MIADPPLDDGADQETVAAPLLNARLVPTSVEVTLVGAPGLVAEVEVVEAVAFRQSYPESGIQTTVILIVSPPLAPETVYKPALKVTASVFDGVVTSTALAVPADVFTAEILNVAPPKALERFVIAKNPPVKAVVDVVRVPLPE